MKPCGDNACTVNRIAWLFEDTFREYLSRYITTHPFDYSILKSGIEYSKNDYKQIQKIKNEYDDSVKYYQRLSNSQRLDKDEVSVNRNMMLLKFKSKCEEICSNKKELCDLIVDMCYSTEKSKQFAWDICGETIIENLLEKNNYIIYYPQLVNSDGEFEFGGEQFIMCSKKLKEDEEVLLY